MHKTLLKLLPKINTSSQKLVELSKDKKLMLLHPLRAELSLDAMIYTRSSVPIPSLHSPTRGVTPSVTEITIETTRFTANQRTLSQSHPRAAIYIHSFISFISFPCSKFTCDDLSKKSRTMLLIETRCYEL